MCKLCLKPLKFISDGAPCAVKAACTVRSGGKSSDNFKGLPIAIRRQNAGNILTRQTLLERLWDIDGNFVDDHALTATINRLRTKIEDDTHTYIKTVRGMGYAWMGVSK